MTSYSTHRNDQKLGHGEEMQGTMTSFTPPKSEIVKKWRKKSKMRKGNREIIVRESSMTSNLTQETQGRLHTIVIHNPKVIGDLAENNGHTRQEIRRRTRVPL